MTIEEWEQQVAEFWASFDAAPPESDEQAHPLVARLDALTAHCPADDGRGEFERGCVRDSTGRTAEAVGHYVAGLAAGLDEVRRTRTLVQMASSRRVLGELDEALEIITQADPHALGGAPGAVLALVLHDLGRPDDALRVAIEALVPHLPRYRRSMSNYARLLTEPE
ncbi:MULTISPECIES: tetratricopeptide repeat protein [unclassified Leifsonia]|uniref:tetratricopeptide repeat protein n=1 Tax=unclassified Leifsonia TaxID=2663824 RepID=UPI0006F76DE2|nr:MULTISPECIES: tetratricopeptide repeat protein [unclassified Leifsonia]KQX07429.1 hypothetical protein ASC59_06610 [Leifsonia sp. Root1293]KRA11711.1 hypothetical protein ASD61_06610 [Leifsonia sp. Root60]